MDDKTKGLIRLGLLLADFGIPKMMEMIRLAEQNKMGLPELKSILDDIAEYQPRADAVAEKISNH